MRLDAPMYLMIYLITTQAHVKITECSPCTIYVDFCSMLTVSVAEVGKLVQLEAWHAEFAVRGAEARFGTTDTTS